MYLYFLPLITCDRLIYYFRPVSQNTFGGAIFIINITYFTVWSIFSNMQDIGYLTKVRF